MTLKSTKILKGIQEMNQLKNLCWEMNYFEEHKKLISVRNTLLKKYQKLKELKQ